MYFAGTMTMTKLLVLSTTTTCAAFFVGNQSHNNNNPGTKTMNTQLFYEVFPDVSPKDDSGLSYAERSRPYRRDMYTYEDWIKHRSSERFSGRFIKFIQSGIVRALMKEVLNVTCVAIFILFFNALFVYGFDDLGGYVHYETLLNTHFPALRLPFTFFALSSPALSLLLVFKTNTSYQRWDEARKDWGIIVNNSRTIMRQASVWIQKADISSDEKQRLLDRLRVAVWAFPRAMTRHLLSANEDELAYCADIRANVPSELAEELISSRHRPARALYEISHVINDIPLSDFRCVALDSAASALCDAMGSCERIFNSPVPRFYTRHTSRFLEVWLLLMPFTLYDAFGYTWNHIGMIPATVVISFFLLGIEELGIQLEEPLSLLPQHKISSGIGLSAEEHVDWFMKDESNYRTGKANVADATLGFPLAGKQYDNNNNIAGNIIATNQTIYRDNDRPWH